MGFMLNWKTTILGIGTLIFGGVQMFAGDMSSGIANVTAGFGLIFAKDV